MPKFFLRKSTTHPEQKHIPDILSTVQPHERVRIGLYGGDEKTASDLRLRESLRTELESSIFGLPAAAYMVLLPLPYTLRN